MVNCKLGGKYRTKSIFVTHTDSSYYTKNNDHDPDLEDAIDADANAADAMDFLPEAEPLGQSSLSSSLLATLQCKENLGQHIIIIISFFLSGASKYLSLSFT